MADTQPLAPPPIARSPIAPAPPVAILHGWEVSQRRTDAALTLSDRTPLAKVLVRADPDGAYAHAARVGFGGVVRVDGGALVVGSGIGEWLLLGRVGAAAALIAAVEERVAEEFVSATDVTHGRALVRLTGDEGPLVLSKLCAVDLADDATPNRSAFRSSVARVVTDVARDDLGSTRSYLVHCERSAGQYLFDAILNAGADFGLEVAGFADDLSGDQRATAD